MHPPSLRRSNNSSTNEKLTHLPPSRRPGAFGVRFYPRDDDSSSDIQDDLYSLSDIGNSDNDGLEGIPEARQVDEDRELELFQLVEASARRVEDLQQQVEALEEQRPLIESVVVEPDESQQQNDDLQRLYESLEMAHFIISRQEFEWQEKKPAEMISFSRQ